MSRPHLVLPSEEYKTTFIAAVKEFHADGYRLNTGGMGKYKDVKVESLEEDFPAYLRLLADFAAGRNLGPDLVPQSTYWLVDAAEFVGRVSLRHRLNENLSKIGGHIGYEIRPSMRRKGYGTLALKLGLVKARDLGIRRALITCDSINIPSRRIIESNGGKLESELLYDESKPPKCRFWIDLP